MYLDYSKLEFDKDGIPETPQLVLKTLAEGTIGVIPGVSNIKLNIKFSEPSELSFDVSSIVDGDDNWIYPLLTGYKIIYTDHYGIYVTLNPKLEADGIADVKHMTCYSIEQLLGIKKLFLEEGTFKFYNDTDPYDEGTVMGRILEAAPDWKPGYIAPAVAQQYRTFDQFTDYLDRFVYDTAAQKYRCAFVFDPYKRTISVYDADEERTTLPIYLDFDNLLTKYGDEELSKELVTAVRPYGADELDITNVNPIGTNWLYDISYFIDNGDIPSGLAEKWQAWQKLVLNRQAEYKGLTALRASATAQLLSAEAVLRDLQGELDSLMGQQSVAVQALAMETKEEGIATQQKVLDDINQKIAAKNEEISKQEAVISGINDNLDSENEASYTSRIQKIVDELALEKHFTDAEYTVLTKYLIEQDITENTFVATDVDTAVSGTNYQLESAEVSVSESSLLMVDIPDFGKTMYIITGGKFAVNGDPIISGDIIRGTLEIDASSGYILSFYTGKIYVGEKSAQSGMISISGMLSDFTTDTASVTVDEVTTQEGTKFCFDTDSGYLYLTADVSDYQRYSVQMELYDYAVDMLSDLANPTVEFSVESGNFIFEQNFEPFRNELELGKGVYLNVKNHHEITPYIIEFELSFEERNKFSIVFSNRFKRHDNVNTLRDMIEKGYSSSRSFDASKHIYNQTAGQASVVSEFMRSSIDAAVNTIKAAANQSVLINGAGINVGGNSKYQLRVVNNMIAMTDDNWQTAKLAIGRFASDALVSDLNPTGEYWGINSDVLGGKLIVGNNLVLENEKVDENGNPTGVMQFKVDSSGAWLNNSTFILQKDNGGKIIIDPQYGIVAGNGNLFTTNGTDVIPAFIDSNGNIIDSDNDGMPDGASFYLDMDGNAYFNGTVFANSGDIGGWKIDGNKLVSKDGSGKTTVALNASGTNDESLYAIWAGAENPESAPFWVMKDGSIHAKSGDFSGTLSAAKVSGALTPAEDGGWVFGCGISVGGTYDTPNDPTTTDPRQYKGNFYVSPDGDVVMKGGIVLDGDITWGTDSVPVKYQFSTNMVDWHDTMDTNDLYRRDSLDGGKTWGSAYQFKGTNGRPGSDANVTRDNIYNALVYATANDGIYQYGSNIGIRATAIRAGIIDADDVTLGSTWGGFCCAEGSVDETTKTHGAKMFGSAGKNGAYYIIATNAGCRMSAGSSHFYVTNGLIKASMTIDQTSDLRLKTDFDYDMSKFEDAFLSLKPMTYHFSDGRSTKKHIGFGAQDVEEALKQSGIDSDSYALVSKEPITESRDDGLTGAIYGLAYSEFIPIHTHMIQKLCREVEDLKTRLYLLEHEQ